MSFPSLTPTQHTKALWVVGVGIAVMVVIAVMELAAPPTIEEGDVKAAKQEAKRRGRTWEPDLVKRLRAIRRRGEQLTKVYNEGRR